MGSGVVGFAKTVRVLFCLGAGSVADLSGQFGGVVRIDHCASDREQGGKEISNVKGFDRVVGDDDGNHHVFCSLRRDGACLPQKSPNASRGNGLQEATGYVRYDAPRPAR